MDIILFIVYNNKKLFFLAVVPETLNPIFKRWFSEFAPVLLQTKDILIEYLVSILCGAD